MKTETLGEKLESIDCRRDDKARRVSNCAPDTIAEITADELENGVSLERLEALNVPVLAYSGQVTIHGKLPVYDEKSRPAGYKSLIKNGNGSIGVKFCAVDAEKKEIIRRASRVSQSGWHTFANCSGFYAQRSFYVKNEGERAGRRAATVDTLKSFPVSLFYGSAGAYSLPYGLGYAVEVNIGAIPAANLWEFISKVFHVEHLADLEAREAVEKAKQDEKDAIWQAACDARTKEREAANLAKVAGLVTLSTVPESGEIFILTRGELLGVKLEKVKGKTFYTVETRDGSNTYNTRKVCAVFPWSKSLAAGRVYAEKEPEIAAPALSPATVDAPAAPSEISAEKAAQPYRGNKPAALAAVSALIGQPVSV